MNVMMRYQVFACEPADGTLVPGPTLLGETDDAAAAKNMAREQSYHGYGACIVDTSSGEVDLGFGFGKPIPADDIE